MKFNNFLEACKDGDLARIQRGLPDVNLRQTNSDGCTPLMLAARHGHVQMVTTLLPGSDLWQADNQGWSSLMRAAWRGHEARPRGDCQNAHPREQSAASEQ